MATKLFFGGATTAMSKDGTKTYKKVNLIIQRDDNTESATFFVDDDTYAKCEGKPMFTEVQAVFMPGYQGRCNLEDISFGSSSSSASKGKATSVDDFKI